MREFNFSKEYSTLLTPEIVSLVGKIHEYKGEQALFIEAKADNPSTFSISAEEQEMGTELKVTLLQPCEGLSKQGKE